MKSKIIEYLNNVYIKIDKVDQIAKQTPYLVVCEDSFYVEISSFFAIRMNISVARAYIINKELVVDINQSFRLSNLLCFFNANDVIITNKQDEEGNALVRIKINIS